MAHIKAGAVTKGNRDSIAKKLGVKLFAGQKVIPGNILVRQKGTKFNAGVGTKMGGDYTIYAVQTGILNFITRLGKKFLTVN
ncbi:MAG: 50S ribosomal protein L27 [Patescibacteria group bacterium]